MTARSYGVLRPEVGKVNVCLRNYSVKQITLPKQTAVGMIVVANAIPTLLASKSSPYSKGKVGGQKELLEEIDLTGVQIGVWMTKRRYGTSSGICQYTHYVGYEFG